MSKTSLVEEKQDLDVDLVDAKPTREHPSGNSEFLKAAWYDYPYIGGCVILYLADVVTDMLVSVKYFRNGDYIWFSLTLASVFGASFVMMIFSLKWFYDDTADEVSKTKTVLLHVLQLGPLKRYWDCYKNGKRTRTVDDKDGDYYNMYIEQWRDIAMLRLFEVFIESAPQLVLQLYILAYNRHFDKEKDWLTACSACFSLLSLSTSIVSYSKALRDASNTKGKMTWWAFGCQIVWRITMVASRIVTLVLFASVYKSWILLVIGLHWIAMTIWIVHQKPSFCSDNRILKHMFPVVIGFVYVFCFFNVKDGFTRKRLIFFYSVMLVENVALMGALLPYRHEYGVVFVAAMGMVFGGFAIGVLALVLYYQCYHPSLQTQGIFIRTSHDVPTTEGIVYRVICCNTCCLVRCYEDEASSPSRGSRLHVNIPVSRGSVRNDIVRGEGPSSPPFESEILFHKPSQLQKQYSLEKEKIKREKAERARRRHSVESAIGKRIAKSGEFHPEDINRALSQPVSPPGEIEISHLANIPQRNGSMHVVDIHTPKDVDSSQSTNFELKRCTSSEGRNENEMSYSVGIREPHVIRNGHGPVVDNSFYGNVPNHPHEIPQDPVNHATIHMNPEAGRDLNHNSSRVFRNVRQDVGGLGSDSEHLGTNDANQIRPPCDDGIHCGTDDEGSGTCDDGVHCGTDDEKETKKSCDDGVHCGTDDEKETKKSCDDGVHCGTDDEKETKTSCDDGIHCGTDDEKETKTSCGDGVHCGTDDEKETKTSCDDGVHCGTDDEESTKTDKPSLDLASSNPPDGRNKSSRNSSKNLCDDETYCEKDHVSDTFTMSDNNVRNKTASRLDAPFKHLPKYLDSVKFNHRYSIVSDCISLSSSTSSDNENDEFLEKKLNLDDKPHPSERTNLIVEDQSIDTNKSEELLDKQEIPLDIVDSSPQIERNTKRSPKQRTINRRSRQSNRVSFPNFVATNLRRGRFSSLRRSSEDCAEESHDTRRHTIDFSLLPSTTPDMDTVYADLRKILRPKKFGSVRDELDLLSIETKR